MPPVNSTAPIAVKLSANFFSLLYRAGPTYAHSW